MNEPILNDKDKKALLELYKKGLVTLEHLKSLGIEIEEKVKSSYDSRPVREKIEYDLQPMKFLTHFIKTGIVLLIIAGLIYGWGWYQGTQGKPVQFDLQGKEATIKLNEHYLRIEKDGTANVIDKDGKVLKVIKVKDIPELRKAIRPYGFKLEPIALVGGSIGEAGAGFEGGAGVSWFKFYKANLDSFLTSRGLYPLGVSYSITDNSGIGLGGGIGYKGDKRAELYYYFKF
jgi:hypothetical protein